MRAPWLAVVACACGSDPARPIDAVPVPPDAAVAPFCTPRPGTALRLQLVNDQLILPVALAAPRGDPRLFVVEQDGRIRVIVDGVLLEEPFLSIDVNLSGGEQGFLGLAFHPRYAENGRFFVFYVGAGDALHIAEYHADPASNVADPDETPLVTIEHPGAQNHNGGTLDFGPDGQLYASVGDGAFAPNAQDPDSRLGKILRIDVDGDRAVERFAWGLRNPWRMAFDPDTGDLWIADVGAASFEEIDVSRAGQSDLNFGWSYYEGPLCAGGGCDTPGLTPPVFAYDRRETAHCTVIGGAVYRGGCMPDLDGTYFFADFCSRAVWTLDAATPGDATEITAELDPEPRLLDQIAGFGTDGYGELYILTRSGRDLYRIELE
jgi:hypothetical protein